MSNKSRRNAPQRRAAAPNRPSRTSPNSRPQQTAGGFRSALERHSARWLVLLHGLPRWVFPILLALFLFIGLISSGPWTLLGAVLLGIVTLFVAWLSALAWPVLTSGSRLARVVLVAALAGVTVLKALGRL